MKTVDWYINRLEEIETTLEGDIDRVTLPYSKDPIHWEPEINVRVCNLCGTTGAIHR